MEQKKKKDYQNKCNGNGSEFYKNQHSPTTWITKSFSPPGQIGGKFGGRVFWSNSVLVKQLF